LRTGNTQKGDDEVREQDVTDASVCLAQDVVRVADDGPDRTPVGRKPPPVDGPIEPEEHAPAPTDHTSD
jgi:hypothetical protein